MENEENLTNPHLLVCAEGSIVYIVVSRGTVTDRSKEGNLLFNDPHNTFYLRLYGVGQREKKPAAAT